MFARDLEVDGPDEGRGFVSADALFLFLFLEGGSDAAVRVLEDVEDLGGGLDPIESDGLEKRLSATCLSLGFHVRRTPHLKEVAMRRRPAMRTLVELSIG